jgi:acetyltransferase EpsM
MSAPNAITIPLINPNEPGSLLAELFVSPGQFVHQGDRLCTLETTKATLELTADVTGYVVGLTFQVGQTIQAGETLAYLADSPDQLIPQPSKEPMHPKITTPQGLRISQPALQLALQHNVDLAQFSGEIFITEKDVQQLIDSAVPETAFKLQTSQFDPDAIIIYGGGGHGKILIDLLRALEIYPIAGIVDDGLAVGSLVMGVPVLGGSAILPGLFEKGIHFAANAVGGIGNIDSRIKVFDRLAQVGFTCPTLVHPAAFVETSATLAEGTQVMPLAYVGSEAHVGFGVIINTGAIVSHDCTLGDYANLSPGAIMAGEVTLGNAVLVGMGVTLNLRVQIGDRARIGNSATVKQDVPANSIVHAGEIWPD